MKSLIVLSIQLCFVFAIVSVATAGGVPKGPKRSRMSTSGLLPFPRVGRSEQIPWDLDPMETHEDVKRTKFMQFPRVGRQPYDESVERTRSKNSGLWFGPRLGRLQKRDGGYAYIFELYPRQIHYTPRLGRESEEFDDNELATQTGDSAEHQLSLN